MGYLTNVVLFYCKTLNTPFIFLDFNNSQFLPAVHGSELKKKYPAISRFELTTPCPTLDIKWGGNLLTNELYYYLYCPGSSKAVKVRQIRNDFFKPTILSKNDRTNSTLLLVDLFLFVFWKKVKTPKRHFEISWPLAFSNISYIIINPNNFWLILAISWLFGNHIGWTPSISN